MTNEPILNSDSLSLSFKQCQDRFTTDRRILSLERKLAARAAYIAKRKKKFNAARGKFLNIQHQILNKIKGQIHQRKKKICKVESAKLTDKARAELTKEMIRRHNMKVL